MNLTAAAITKIIRANVKFGITLSPDGMVDPKQRGSILLTGHEIAARAIIAAEDARASRPSKSKRR